MVQLWLGWGFDNFAKLLCLLIGFGYRDRSKSDGVTYSTAEAVFKMTLMSTRLPAPDAPGYVLRKSHGISL